MSAAGPLLHSFACQADLCPDCTPSTGQQGCLCACHARCEVCHLRPIARVGRPSLVPMQAWQMIESMRWTIRRTVDAFEAWTVAPTLAPVTRARAHRWAQLAAERLAAFEAEIATHGPRLAYCVECAPDDLLRAA
mgnify:CR=1 FL=1